jgi:formylglycine-generating enzyme required for sulfatase activity
MTKNSLQYVLSAIWLLCTVSVFAQPEKGVGVKTKKVVDGKRLALVIGNADYENGGKLFNTVNDSADMQKVLREVGFTVMSGDNLSGDQMKKLIKDFGRQLSQGGIGLFYFSGHGIQANGKNYLIPVDAPEILREQTLEFDAVDVNRILGEMGAAKNGFNIVILDACRNNPFSKGWRDSSGGLAQIKAPTGTLLGYATAPDTVASDGKRKNGTYTEKLLQRIRIPNLTIEQVFKGVSEDVYDETDGKQDPWYASSLKGDFYFINKGGRVIQPQPDKVLQLEKIKNSMGMEFILIPAGSFAMGTPSAELDKYEWETSPIQVDINNDFYLGKYEITQNQWKLVMGTNPSDFENCPKCPVENVSWLDIQNFIKKLNAGGDGRYRLPTELEWEYAARARTRTRYYWGEDRDFTEVKDFAWYGGNSQFKTHEVGLKKPNAFGLHDMSGNVWEWCEDRWEPSSSRRVFRGGSWLSSSSHLRSAIRSDQPPSTRHSYVGFRLLRED